MITATTLPADAFLNRYAERDDCFTDCYRATLAEPVEFGTFICAFYDSWAFLPEKALLKLWTGRTPAAFDPLPLALGDTDSFAVWNVEARAPTQLLLSDEFGNTRSWLHVDGSNVYFGSAVVPRALGADLGPVFRALLGFHKFYSRILLRSAISRFL